MNRLFLLPAVLVLAACGQSESDVGGISAGDAKALNEAAAKLDAQMPKTEAANDTNMQDVNAAE